MVFYKYLSLTDPHIVVAAVGRWYNRDVFSWARGPREDMIKGICRSQFFALWMVYSFTQTSTVKQYNRSIIWLLH